MRWMLILLTCLLIGLQARLWLGQGSWAEVATLGREIDEQQQENKRLSERNAHLLSEVNALKHGLDGVEQRARSELGLIKEGETYYLLLDKE